LHWAAWNGQLHTVRALLEFKAAQLLALRAERACREQAARAQSGNGDDQASPTPSPLSTDKSARPVQLTQALAPLRLQHLLLDREWMSPRATQELGSVGWLRS
jgi:ankyrin repeat protein